MDRVTISKKEYAELKKYSQAYKKKAGHFFSSILRKPIKSVIEDFKNTGLYSKKFLEDFEKGIKKSSYSK